MYMGKELVAKGRVSVADVIKAEAVEEGIALSKKFKKFILNSERVNNRIKKRTVKRTRKGKK